MLLINKRMLRRFVSALLIFNITLSVATTIVSGQQLTKGDDSSVTSKSDDTEDSTPDPETSCSPAKFTLTGNNSNGSNGNVRTFNSGTFSVKASAFSRRKSDGLWQNAALGAFESGLGVTDRSEDGSDGTHRVDNVDNHLNYILLEFRELVVIDNVFLDSVVNDSDITVWVGNATNPYNNHITMLSDALLGSFGPAESNDTTSSNARSADINGGNKVGNVVIIAASTTDDTPEDNFKLRYMDVDCVPSNPARVEIRKQVETTNNSDASTASFGFTATNLSNPSFSLVDNNVVGPDRYVNPGITNFTSPITVNESTLIGWELLDVTCTGIPASRFTYGTRGVTFTPNAGESIVCTFVNGQFIPSSAMVSVTGRALTTAMRGAAGVVVVLYDPMTGEQRIARTNTFGYYTFEEVELGKLYTVSVSTKKMQFAPDSHTLLLSDYITDLNFVQVQ